MDDKSVKKTLSDILLKVSNCTTVNTDLQKDVKIIVELVNTMDQRVADISMKVDQFLNAGSKKPKAIPKKITTPVKKVVKKVPIKKNVVNNSDDDTEIAETTETAGVVPIGEIKNILSYFKTRYVEDPECFSEYLEENQAKSLFMEHENTINSKKEGEARTKHKATILYKALTKTQKSKIREMMETEKEHFNADNSNDLEPETAEYDSN
jgi:hypothetical protein